MIDDLGPAHVEDELLAALGPLPAGHADRPIRVSLEQLAPLADHLWLDPQPEPQPECLDRAGQPVDAIGQLAAGGFIDKVGVRLGYGLALIAWSLSSIMHVLAQSAVGYQAQRPNF